MQWFPRGKGQPSHGLDEGRPQHDNRADNGNEPSPTIESVDAGGPNEVKKNAPTMCTHNSEHDVVLFTIVLAMNPEITPRRTHAMIDCEQSRAAQVMQLMLGSAVARQADGVDWRPD
jgi:hypothetical protein